ncbi:MAG: LytR/AlgR family response regulator transcription factor [Chitinophagales bacterium]
MNFLIIEDEYHAAKMLTELLSTLEPQATILEAVDSVEDAVEWFQSHEMPDLIFMDIQLADGLSFDIFRQVKVNCPVIFTTAFDRYSLQAFKVNSVDYLLKPIEKEELAAALQKFHRYHQQASKVTLNNDSLQNLIQQLAQPKPYKGRFLLKHGQTWEYLASDSVNYLYSADGLTFLVDNKGKRHALDESLEQLQNQLDPSTFFRINRQQIIHIEAIQKMHSWFNHRFKLEMAEDKGQEFIVSRKRTKEFKEWLSR